MLFGQDLYHHYDILPICGSLIQGCRSSGYASLPLLLISVRFLLYIFSYGKSFLLTIMLFSGIVALYIVVILVCLWREGSSEYSYSIFENKLGCILNSRGSLQPFIFAALIMWKFIVKSLQLVSLCLFQALTMATCNPQMSCYKSSAHYTCSPLQISGKVTSYLMWKVLFLM